MAHRIVATAALLVLVLAATPSSAEITEAAKAEARVHFQRGKAAFELGRFAEALQAYEQAYKLAPLPGFLFNIGQCHRNLDNFDKAIFSFRLYLRKLPAAPNRKAVQILIHELEQKSEDARQRQAALRTKIPTYHPVRPRITDPDPRPLRPPPPVPFYKKWWFWVPVSVVVVGAASVSTYFAVRPGDPSLPSSDLGVVDWSR